MRTQLSAFYNKYKGFQFNVVEPSTGFSGVENIADVTIKGFEAQVQARVRGFGYDANVAYVGPQFAYLGYSPLSDRIDGRGLLSALVTLDMGDWQVTAYGTNLTDKNHVSGQFNSNEFYGAPREYGVRVRVAF